MINNDSVVLLIVTVFTGIDVYAQMNNDNYVSYFNCFNDNVIIQLAPPFPLLQKLHLFFSCSNIPVVVGYGKKVP